MKKRVKVLHVVSNISVGNGIMSMLMNYYRWIDKNSIQFDFLYFDDRNITFKDEIESLGGKTIQFPSVKKYSEFVKEKNRISTELFAEYDILHIHDVFMIAFFMDVKKKWGIKKIVIHSHSTRFSDHLIGGIRNRILAIPNFWIPDFYLACSMEAGVYAFGKRFKGHGKVITNAIDTNNFRYNQSERNRVREELGLTSNFVIGHIGGFTNQKNHSFIIDVFEKVLEKNNNARLVLISDGPLKEQIEDTAKEKKIDKNVLFLGTRNDVNRLMQAFDCFILPSRYEGLGIVLVEAQTAGLPCIFSDVVPDSVNICKDKNSVLSLNEPKEKWADCILNADIKRVDNTNKIIAAGYDIQSEANKLLELYTELLNSI